jgi:hypothetical protein
MRNKKTLNLNWFFSTLHLFVPTMFFFLFFTHTHYTSYFTCHIIPHIYAVITLIFHPILKTKTGTTRCKQTGKQTKTGTTRCKQTLGVYWRRCKTVHIIGIEQVQTGSDPFRPVKYSRWATATERNWAVTETFLSVWTSLFNYTWENFSERWRSATERKRDV